MARVYYRKHWLEIPVFDYNMETFRKKYNLPQEAIDEIYDNISDMIVDATEGEKNPDNYPYCFATEEDFRDTAHNTFYGEWYDEIYDEVIHEIRQNDQEEADEKKEEREREIQEAYQKGYEAGFALPD